MTDLTPSPDDAIVSAHLDGEASPAERARMAVEPELQARLEAFRRVAAQVGSPVEGPTATQRNAAIASALDAADLETTAPVVELDAVRTRRARSSRWLPIASVAAAVLLVLAALPLLSRLGSDSSDQASSAAATTTAAAAAPQAGGAGNSTAGSAETLAVPLDGADLGAFADEAAMRTAADSLLNQLFTATEGAVAADSSAAGAFRLTASCDPAIRADFPDLGERLLSATAFLRGQSVDVLVFALTDPGSGPTRQLLAVDPTSCAIVNAQAF